MTREAIATARRLVVKVGSSSLTTAAGGLDPARLDALVDALAAREGQLVLVSSGAIAAGLAPLGLARRPRELALQQAAASVGQMLLVQRYASAFGRHGRTVGQVLLTADDVVRRSHYRNAQTTLDRLLGLGVVPVVNENDAVATDEIRFGDNDRLAALVAHIVRADALVLLSDVDGLYDGDPRRPGTSLVERVRGPQDVAELSIGGTGSAGLGSGGMASKVEAAALATGAGVPVLLSATAHVAAALRGEGGTVFDPTGSRSPGRLLWLAHASTPRGRLLLDDGAVAAVVDRRLSLLPAGVTAVEGDFAAGDPVELAGADGRPVARGLVAYDATELPALLGRSTRELGLREVVEVAERARVAAAGLAPLARKDKDAALRAMADALVARADEVLAANAEDVAAGREAGTSEAMLDRLSLTTARVEAMADGLRHVATLPDPVGEVVRGSSLPNGLELRQVRVPLGVVGIVYEARPNVTADAAGLCLKSGNAVLLRGSASAYRSNRVLVDVLADAATAAGMPADSIQLVPGTDRSSVKELMQARGLVDVLIPRGGAGLIDAVVTESQVPVIETGVGNCTVYVDASADLDKAVAITVNSKTHRPSVCNAAETLLVHADVAQAFLPRAVEALKAAGVVLHADERARAYDPDAVAVTDEDWAAEYLSLDLAVGVVDSLDDAVAHIRRWGSGHTEAIVTRDVDEARRFVRSLDSAAVMVNASTRFTDGGEFGFGAEIGISTQKLHARGPMGLPELTSTTYVVTGAGHVRD